jgi:hypothetical protein
MRAHLRYSPPSLYYICRVRIAMLKNLFSSFKINSLMQTSSVVGVRICRNIHFRFVGNWGSRFITTPSHVCKMFKAILRWSWISCASLRRGDLPWSVPGPADRDRDKRFLTTPSHVLLNVQGCTAMELDQLREPPAWRPTTICAWACWQAVLRISNVNDIETKAQTFRYRSLLSEWKQNVLIWSAYYWNESKTFWFGTQKILLQANLFWFGTKILGQSKSIWFGL